MGAPAVFGSGTGILTLAEELLAQAERGDEASMRLAGLWATCTSHYFLGEFMESVHDADSILAGYDPVRDRHLADWLNHDPKTVALTFKACAQWKLGYPDSAARLSEEALAHSRARRHAFDLGWALHFVLVHVFHYRREPERCAPLLEEFESLAHEQRLLFFEQVVAPLCRGLLFLQLHRPREADLEFRAGIPGWCEAGMRSGLPVYRTQHAVSEALIDRLEHAQRTVEEVLDQIGRPGWEERYTLSETLRIKGWLLQRRGDAEQAETCFREAIDVARQQRAKSFELRAATSYARLLKDRGRRAEAMNLLQPVYDWFTEGRSTKDHIEAKALLDELRA